MLYLLQFKSYSEGFLLIIDRKRTKKLTERQNKILVPRSDDPGHNIYIITR